MTLFLKKRTCNLTKDKVGKYTTGELVKILKLIQKIEEGIKTGLIEETISLDYLLVNIL